MGKEFEALEANHIWYVVPIPIGKKAIGSKWAYKIKFRADGSVERYKARLVVRGDTQTAGIDYNKSFSPMIKMTTVKCLITGAVNNQWPLFQLDVNNVFLYEGFG
ncbi:putative mitochondrial protein AtMg00820 [Nicotiana tabacum]|uniref:Mitochondrial protein AtMg00820 n=1 Tax=Nicotiana tabacum TaxID=4097 RepID=A0AC58UC22_TOBAC